MWTDDSERTGVCESARKKTWLKFSLTTSLESTHVLRSLTLSPYCGRDNSASYCDQLAGWTRLWARKPDAEGLLSSAIATPGPQGSVRALRKVNILPPYASQLELTQTGKIAFQEMRRDSVYKACVGGIHLTAVLLLYNSCEQSSEVESVRARTAVDRECYGPKFARSFGTAAAAFDSRQHTAQQQIRSGRGNAHVAATIVCLSSTGTYFEVQ